MHTMKSEKLITQFSVCFAVLIYFFTVSAHAQEPNQVHVPDSVFRSILRNKYDITFNAENKITNPEVATNLLEIFIDGGVSNLTGIEAFTSLEQLNISGSKIASLNLSANKALTFLNCSHNQITTLDLSANKVLALLDCSYNQLTVLDLSANALLKTLICSDNQLTQLNLSHEAVVSNFFSCPNNQLSDFDFWNMKLRYDSYYKRQSLIYKGNDFPSDYNNLFPLVKDQIIKFLYILSFFLVYLFFILYMLFQKHEDGKRNKKLNVWIVVANIILLPVWISYFSPEKLSGIQTAPYIVLILFPSFLIGNFMQLVPLITKLGAVGRQKGTIKLIGLIIVMLYLFYRLAESFFLSA